MRVRRTKPQKASPVLEKLNLERLRECGETNASARKTIETSKKLTEEAQVLVDSIHKRRRRAG
jgi:hypothetical protein